MSKKADKRTAYVQKWKDQGIEVNASFDDEPRVASVHLPFTPAEWADLLNASGTLLPSCCANISAMRDILNDAMRNDGDIRVSEFETLAHYGNQHEGFEDANHPIRRAINIWEKVKDEAQKQHGVIKMKPDDPKDALHMLYFAAAAVTSDDLYSKDHDSSDTATCRSAGRLQTLFGIKGAVSTLYRKLQELDTGPVYGHALVYKGEIITHQLGLWVVSDPKYAEKLRDDFNKGHELEEQVVIRKVRVTLEKGVEYVSDDDFVQPAITPAKDIEI